MALTQFHFFILFVCIACLCAQLMVKEKHTSHILFAVFCGSIAMAITQKIAGDAIGAYKYLIGLGTVATCNCYWLLSRSLFRKEKAIEKHHLIFAFAISLLIFVKQGYLFASTSELISATRDSLAWHVLSEITVLLSSCVLVLSFWEGCRNFNEKSPREKKHSILFLTSFAVAVSSSKLSNGVFADAETAKMWVIGCVTLLIVINTQVLLVLRYRKVSSPANLKSTKAGTIAPLHPIAITSPQNNENAKNNDEAHNEAEVQLAQQVTELVAEQQGFLQANLKVADIARTLDVPEYRVSNAVRNQLKAKNFNQFVNRQRIEYAEQLLLDEDKLQWSVLVISLESGFASVGPFTRAFKTQTGYTPNQYRQHHLASVTLQAS